MFTGKEPHEIPAEQAKAYVRKWREKAPKGRMRGGFFGREVLEKILAQPGCVGFRIYHATHAKGHDTFVIVGADADGRDLWSGSIAEEAIPCPPSCPPEEL